MNRPEIGDEIKCPNCDGKGEIEFKSTNEYGEIIKRTYKICERCSGKGRIDWWNYKW